MTGQGSGRTADGPTPSAVPGAGPRDRYGGRSHSPVASGRSRRTVPAVPVPQNVKTLALPAFFTHSLAKVRS